MSYKYRSWREGDREPTHFHCGTRSLFYDEMQVGVTFGTPLRIMKIETFAKGQGHGQELIRRIVEEARELKRNGQTNEQYLVVIDVIGDSNPDKLALEHILRDKFGFEYEGNYNWRLLL